MNARRNRAEKPIPFIGVDLGRQDKNLGTELRRRLFKGTGIIRSSRKGRGEIGRIWKRMEGKR
jgi:hypothetical protein